MSARTAPPRFTPALLHALLLAVLSVTGLAADEPWLSDSERRFFEAMGVEAKVDGATTKRTADIDAWGGIAAQAPQPLASRITAIVDAYQRMSPTPEEEQKLQQLQVQLQNEIQSEMRNVVLGALLDVDSFDQARQSTRAIMNAGDQNGQYVQQSWDLRKKILLRGLEARETADRNLTLITQGLEQRTGKKLSADHFSVSLAASGKSLALSGDVGKVPLKTPVVQLVLHRSQTNGQWTGLNAFSSGLGLSLGLMDASEAVTGTELSVAQERAMNLPWSSTLLLPDLASSSRVNIVFPLPVEVALAVERAELFVWTDQGSLHVGELSGLDVTRRRAQYLAEQNQETQAASQGRGQVDPRQQSRQQAQAKAMQEQQALRLLTMGRRALARKDHRGASNYFQQAIRTAPDSRAAKTAQSLLQKLQP